MKALETGANVGKFILGAGEAMADGAIDGMKIGALAGGAAIGGLPTII
ncbi:MAG: hypothetical protein PR2021_7340 (plasmid) [Candidatus Phytoplasma pruni]|nr:MAG: hypothetical protein PR2021_7340 [Candidatus Phytoplasma pruni]